MFSNLTEKITTPIERLTNPLSRRNTANAAEKEQAWHASFPEPRHKTSDLPDVEKEDVLALLKDGKKSGEQGGFLLVDVRRNDHEVCTTNEALSTGSRCSLNWDQTDASLNG